MCLTEIGFSHSKGCDCDARVNVQSLKLFKRAVNTSRDFRGFEGHVDCAERWN